MAEGDGPGLLPARVGPAGSVENGGGNPGLRPAAPPEPVIRDSEALGLRGRACQPNPPQPDLGISSIPTPRRSFNFLEIVELLNVVYCMGMLLEFVAFLWLRVK